MHVYCMDSKYCQYLYKTLKRTVVGIRGMDEYTMKYAYQISENVWLDLEFNLGQTTTFLPLQSC